MKHVALEISLLAVSLGLSSTVAGQPEQDGPAEPAAAPSKPQPETPKQDQPAAPSGDADAKSGTDEAPSSARETDGAVARTDAAGDDAASDDVPMPSAPKQDDPPQAKPASPTQKTAAAPAPKTQPERDAPTLPPLPLLTMLDGWIGVHNTWVTSDEFDIFAEDDALTAGTLGVGVSVMQSDRFGVSVVAFGDTAGKDARLRGDQADLLVRRVGLGPELRWPLLLGGYALGRLAPMAVYTKATLEESSSAATLRESAWSLGGEISVGLGWRLGHAIRKTEGRAVSFWVRAEAGYFLAAERELQLEAKGDSAPVRTQPLDLPDLSLNGVSMRLAGGVGF